MTIIVTAIQTDSGRDYEWLKTSIADWMHRGDLAPRIPDFIALAEARINRIGRVRTMTNEVALETSVGSRLIPLPINFIEPLAVYLEGSDPRQELGAVVPEVMTVSATPGPPQYWCIDGGSLAFERPADQVYKVTLRQIGNFRLSAVARTNAILENYPDVYLFGAQYQAAMYIRNFDLIALCKAQFDQAVKEMNLSESRSRATAPLRTEIAQLLGGGCNR
jgi:hypothetical protein